MRTLRQILVSLLALAPLACARPAAERAASADEPPPPVEWEFTRPPPPVETHAERQLAVETESTLVKRGTPPLVYLVEGPTTVRVVDESTGQQVAADAVPAGTIVRVEPRGVLIGTRRVASGPLPTDRTFAIYTVSQSPNAIVTDSVAPSATPAKGDEQ